ncbi:MAG: hypothetical protein AB7O52_12985 [Planctomycetota bacterium]
MLLDRLKQLFQRKEIPRDAKDLINNSTDVRDLLEGLDSLITQNEVEVEKINEEIAALEEVESREMGRVRSGELPERSKNNVLRRIQRLRKQMDNLEERQRIYNRNINLQIDLVGRVQALDAMELRGVDEDKIDEILADYEDELTRYQGVMDSENLSVGDLDRILDDSKDLAALEAEVMGVPPTSAEPVRKAAQPARRDGAVESAKAEPPPGAKATDGVEREATRDRPTAQQAPAQGENG